jgi:hypothetical protein
VKIFKSQSRFELSVILTNAEALLYYEVFRHQMSVAIPELDNKKFVIKEMDPYSGEEVPENAWHLVIEQEAPEQATPPTTNAGQDTRR